MKNRDFHTFLDYKHAEVHFVYGFIWKSTEQIQPQVFRSGVSARDGGWISPLVHERVIGNLDTNGVEQKWVGAYQPTFELEKRCLEKSGDLASEEGETAKLSLLVPMANKIDLPLKDTNVDLFGQSGAKKKLVSCPVLGRWTLRLFDTGAGTFTVRICLQNFQRLTRQERFCRIQWLLRLVPNMDNAPEGHSETELQKDGPIADSFLFASHWGTCRLFDVMRYIRDRTLGDMPRSLFEKTKPKDKPYIKADDSMLAHDSGAKETKRQLSPFTQYPAGNWYENQTPYTLVTGIVGERDLKQLGRASPMTAKEIASIYARLTLDNRRAHQDFSLLSEDYMRRALDIDASLFRIRNVSHDERLFVAFSKRGAIALTCDQDSLPAVFVIPSILNLFEIMRGRLFAGVAVRANLTDFAREVARSEPAAGEQIDFKTYLQLRKFVVLNLNDPLQYLFDGGSTTELATAADRALAVSETWNRVRCTFDVVDNLMKTWELVRFRRTLEE
jgi:hypothetical protein